jgi:uncharacterized FAD-dependent dehydrogenase
MAGRGSSTVPKSSYVPGLIAADLTEVLAVAKLELHRHIKRAVKDFARSMPQYLSEEAVLIGVESRTSSPIRVHRDPQTTMSTRIAGLFPCGEGAGHAGGIVSAALDGVRVAGSIARLRAGA